MAKFRSGNLHLKDDQKTVFGTNDDYSLWFDGSELRVDTTISGVDPTQAYHLTTKSYVDTQLSTQDDHNELNNLDYASAGHTGFLSTAQFVTSSGDLQTNIDALTHDGFADFVAAEHIDWSDTGAEDIHDDRIAASSVTQHVASIDHDSLLNFTQTEHFTEASIDHGNISGLTDDDHTQYSLVNGLRAFTATISGVTPTEDAHLATKGYVDDKFRAGREDLSEFDSSKAVSFAAFAGTDYTISVALSTTDAIPSVYAIVTTNTTVSGFTAVFSGDIDSENYKLHWIAKYD